MSTRRPRIKAVAALPPRRKIAETSEGARNKPNASKDALDNPLKSPRTPRTYSKSDDKNSPKPHIVSPPALQANPTPKPTAVTEKAASPTRTASPKTADRTTPKPEKAFQVSVITPTPHFRSKPGVFASPRARNNSDRGSFISPPARNSPRPLKSTEVAQKNTTNHVQNSTSISNTGETIGAPDPNIKINQVQPSKGVTTTIPDDYSIPSVPESTTDEAVMDGIVPLEPAKNVPKPVDLLKDEITSENAEVLFDPIVPLPSPSKVRPKLRPVPRLAPHRRNSIQGSASESEDESRRALLGTFTPAPPRARHDSHSAPKESARIRNDSISSSLSQTVHPPPAVSPVKEKHFSKIRRQEMSKRMWRRRRDTVKRDNLTMYDLIFYNPTTNPLIPDQEEIKAKEANAKEAERAAKVTESEEEDEPPTVAPVPQIKLGPNGEIILDEKSLVIKQSDANRKVSSVVREGTWAGSGGGRYTRAARTADWSAPETVRFYRALAAIGTDFTLMAPLFPDRTRRDLKLKFKKEERLNGPQVDKALRSATSWDAARLLDEFTEERRQAALQAEKERLQLLAEKKAERQRAKAAKELRVRHSQGSKALESRMDRDVRRTEMTADDFVQRALKNKSAERRTSSDSMRLRSMPPPEHDPTDPSATPSSFATLTLLRRPAQGPSIAEVAKNKPPNSLNTSEVANVAGALGNIETGSLVVLTVNNPDAPFKTMLQTYISDREGKLTPIALPPTLLNSVMGYMKKDGGGAPRTGILASPQPVNAGPSSKPGVIQVNHGHSAAKRARVGSWNITPL